MCHLESLGWLWRGLDGLVGEWVSVDLVVCDVVVVWVVLAFDCGLTGVMLWIRHSVLGFGWVGWLVGVYCECWLVWLWVLGHW